MNFKFETCYRRQKYPKVNVATRKSVKKKSSGKKKRRKSSNHRHRVKNSYVSSNLFSQNFYPANYFFQDEPKPRQQVLDTRVGVIGRSGYLINRNTPHIHRRLLPSSRMLTHHPWKVGTYQGYRSDLSHLSDLLSNPIKRNAMVMMWE